MTVIVCVASGGFAVLCAGAELHLLPAGFSGTRRRAHPRQTEPTSFASPLISILIARRPGDDRRTDHLYESSSRWMQRPAAVAVVQSALRICSLLSTHALPTITRGFGHSFAGNWTRTNVGFAGAAVRDASAAPTAAAPRTSTTDPT